MQKDTSKIVEELGLCPDFQTFYAENKDYMVSGNLSSLLAELLESVCRNGRSCYALLSAWA